MRFLRTATLTALAAASVSVVVAKPGRSELAAAEPAGAAADLAGGKADDIARGFFGRLPGKTKAFACFERIYDAAHLARHPLQKVGSMVLLVQGEMIAEDPIANYSFLLAMSYKNGPARYFSSGYCGHGSGGAASGLHCGIDCDGGSLDVALAGDTRSTLVSLERIAIWPEKARLGDDPEHHDTLDAGADDKSFRLQRVAPSRCMALVDDKDDLAEISRAK